MGQTAVSIGANVFQFFTRNPRGGAAKPIDKADVKEFLSYAAENGIGPILAHAPYTLNAAGAEPRVREFAEETMADDLERLELTLDLFGDLGDARHCRNLFGPKPGNPHSNYHGGIQSINAVVRFDYHITDYLGVFAFVGYYGLVSDDARHAVKAMRHVDAT